MGGGGGDSSSRLLSAAAVPSGPSAAKCQRQSYLRLPGRSSSVAGSDPRCLHLLREDRARKEGRVWADAKKKKTKKTSSSETSKRRGNGFTFARGTSRASAEAVAARRNVTSQSCVESFNVVTLNVTNDRVGSYDSVSRRSAQKLNMGV